jgi:multiple sugar transport system ATP-binding protein
MAEVRLERLCKRAGSAEIIPDLTLTIHDGEFFVLVGPSGCGKSTLLHLIAGLDTPTAGRIWFDGRDVTLLAPRERDIALVFQSYALYPHMTVAENLAFPLRVRRRSAELDHERIEEEVRRIAGLLGLEPLLGRRPRELSGGQRQRVALGRALIRKPSVFLLDEPLSNLDAQLRAGMRAELRRLHDELGITMVYVTHDQTEAMTLADRLVVLDHGRLQQVGTPQDLYDLPGNVFVAGFIGYPSMNTFEARVDGQEAVAGSIRIPIPEGATFDHTKTVMLGVRPEDIRVQTIKGSGVISDHERKSGTREVIGAVRLVEPTGGQIWVTCEVGPHDHPASDEAPPLRTIVGLAESGFTARPGTHVALSLVGAAPHIFDVKTGARLGSEKKKAAIDRSVASAATR